MENNKLNQPIYINITVLTVIKIILIFLVFFFLFMIREILAVLFISLILASAVDPWVDWLKDKKIPRGLSMLIIYVLMFIVVFGVITLIIPPIIEQVKELSNQFPFISENIVAGYEALKELSLRDGVIGEFLQSRENYPEVVSTVGRVFETVSGFFSGIVTFFLVLVITFYMVVEENAMKKLVWSVTPKHYQIHVMQLVNRMQRKIGLWLRGQLILSIIIFTITYIGLLILGVEYALVLALIAGLTEFVPYFGPILAAIPAIFLSFTQGGWVLAAFTGVLYYIIQLTENNVIVPKLMQKVIGLNPIISIAALLVGLKVGGVVGAILAIPVATAVSVFVRDIFDMNKAEKEETA